MVACETENFLSNLSATSRVERPLPFRASLSLSATLPCNAAVNVCMVSCPSCKTIFTESADMRQCLYRFILLRLIHYLSCFCWLLSPTASLPAPWRCGGHAGVIVSSAAFRPGEEPGASL